ncbi:branched-chain amino acid ABC transporter substrate-binding protein [Vandammella animalimorsus]|uniref:branched-chain amino acid ABC transporter substrate-binding protein n=1 Tax=Vandammella animalimorsus TaxID=2029117 RepID=UPI0031BA47C3
MTQQISPPKSNSRRWLLGGLLATCAAWPAWAQAATAAEPKGEPIRLALVESLSGPFANTGEAVFRNLAWAVERVNARGGVALPEQQGGKRPLQLLRFDSKGQSDEALAALQSARDAGAQYVLQGNSSATAEAILNAVEKNNQRTPQQRMLFLNYSAVDPALTNEKCSFWHFRFDAHADMRMNALMDVLQADTAIKKVYLFGQDYSFGHAVLREARRQLGERRPDIEIVAEEYHPVGRIKDFAPYGAKIKASGAQAVITGNWGNDLTLFIKAAGEVGFDGSFYTFYGNALGAPAAIGDAGIGKVIAVADWLPNKPGQASRAFYQSFRERFPKPADDYVHMRMQLLIEALAAAMEKAGSTEPAAVAQALEGLQVELAGQAGQMRAADHQFQQPLVVGRMQKAGSEAVPFDVEGSGYGFEVVRTLTPEQAQMPHRCSMQRPQ